MSALQQQLLAAHFGFLHATIISAVSDLRQDVRRSFS
jgi:hypothetical protein